MWSIQNIKRSVLLLVLVLSSCVKERIIEKTVPEDKLTQKKAEDLLTYSKDTDVLKIQKESLGKAFLLSPVVYTTGQTPMPNFIKPMIIGFERFGNRLAMYNYTDEQMYDAVPADKLLQTFNIKNEDDTALYVDFKQGFKSVNLIESLTIVMKETLDSLKENASKGTESSIEIKDSFVKNVSYDAKSVYINQVIRSTNRELKTDSNPMNPIEKVQKFLTTESTNDYSFELRPYEVNKNFKPKTFDKSMRVGFFINFKFSKATDDPIPQIAKWDVSEEKGPIELRFSENAPAEMIPVMDEGIQYWNRTFGREIFKRGQSFTKGEKQNPRSIFVYWVPWDSAGFAVAGLQTDPLTGETLKGSIFMTSSWVKLTRDSVKLSLENQNDNNAILKKGTCYLDQAQFLSSSDDLKYVDNNQLLDKSTKDTIRIVFTHEMGHVMGLRHNFVGSSTNPHADEEVMAAEKDYKNGIENKIPISTTVMDYTQSLHTAMQGAYIKNNTLPYDSDAIGWAYFDKEPHLTKYNYCSDEHIMMAMKDKSKSIYGCDRFDRYKNIFKGIIKEQAMAQTQKMIQIVSQLDRVKKQSDSYYMDGFSFDNFLFSAPYMLSSVTNNFSDLMFATGASDKYYSVKAIIDNSLVSLNGSNTIFDSGINDLVKKDLTEIGGYAGIIKSLVDLEIQAQGKLMQDQMTIYFGSDKINNLKNYLSDDEISKLKDKLMVAAKEADENYVANVLKSFPLDNSAGKTISLSFPMGDIGYLVPLFGQVYEKSITKNIKTVIINGETLSVPYSQYGYSDADAQKSKLVFKLTTFDMSVLAIMKTEKERLKSIVITKTVEVLKRTQGNSDFLKDSNTLAELAKTIDWTKISGMSQLDINSEISELKKWEEIK